MGPGACTGFSPGWAKIQDKKFLRARFFSPPPEKFSPTLRGGEIFPEGGKKKISVTLKRARFFSPPLSIFRPPP